jgi:hypothetical protein
VVITGMTQPSDRAELEKHLRHSRKALPMQALFTAVVAAVAWVVHRWLGLPWWLALLLTCFGSLGLAGDSVNIAYIRWRLRRVP